MGSTGFQSTNPKRDIMTFMNTKLITLSVASLLGMAAVVPVFASGSYSNRLPTPPAKSDGGMKLDREKYGLGQKIYDGKIKLLAADHAVAQMDRLKALQARLPASAARKKNLAALAGKLSAEQLDALEYFVQRRFAEK